MLKTSNINIFLSYSTKQKVHAGEIKNILEEFGFSCFLAHEDIKPTRQWLSTILHNLDNCEVFVPILTKDFCSSEWTGQEIGYALAKEKHIIPLKTEINPPGFLGRFQALNYNVKDKFPIEKFLNALNTHPSLSKKIRSQIIRKFCESSSYLEARDNTELLIDIDNINTDELKTIIEACVSNDQIYNMSTVRKLLIGFIRKQNLGGISSKLIARYRKLIVRI